mmetsp:Transcript_84/g.148  ORF Transcript_84/g.148 Transcript_84/m.148 type:complete len:218 (-) Transcript_84:80-733(-)
MGGIASRSGGTAKAVVRPSEPGGNQSVAIRAAQEVSRLMRETPKAPEMDPELLKAIEKVVEVKKKEAINPYPPDPRELARRKAQMEKLQRNATSTPKGRLTEKQLREMLSWRVHKSDPPIAQVAKELDSSKSVARALLLNIGTPQTTVDNEDNRMGLWVVVNHPAMEDTSIPAHVSSSSDTFDDTSKDNNMHKTEGAEEKNKQKIEQQETTDCRPTR